MSKKKLYILWILISQLTGIISGVWNADAIKRYGAEIVKPPFAPPGWVFPIVWTVLYTLMGIGAARVQLSKPTPEQKKGLNLFVAQLIFNFFWSFLFFGSKAYGFALVWLVILWILVLWMTLTFRKSDSLASILQVPYCLWLGAAFYLNLGVWLMNP